MPVADTIPARLFARATAQPTLPALHVKRGDTWHSATWGEYAGEVKRAAKALIALGFESDATSTTPSAACIIGFNRPEWVIADVAAMAAGGVAAGIYTTSSAEEILYILGHAEASIVFVETEALYKKIEQIRDRLPKLGRVVLFRGASAPGAEAWEAFLASGDAIDDRAVDDAIARLRPEALATLIYTSGTTGPPKAVMLSHHNLAWTAATAVDIVGVEPGDRTVSYLPLSHIAEQMFTIHGAITAGYDVFFAESMDRLRDNLVEAQPTFLFGVPRVWEKMHAGIQAKLAEASPVRRAIASWALGVGKQYTDLRNQGYAPGAWLNLQHRLAKRVVFDKVKGALGLGRCRGAISGAAPIGRDVLEFFGALDLTILEVYGQSEDCGPTTINQPGRTRFGTVGQRIHGIEVQLAPDDEVQVRGPNVFMGYYKDPVATAEALVDGWLCSGDLGRFDDDGYLTITGRKKEIIITAGGKNIAPKNLEASLKAESPLIAEAVVIGDRRKFLSALLVIDAEAARKLLGGQGDPGDPGSHPTVHGEVAAAVKRSNARFAQVEHIRKWRVLPRPLSIEHGELTPTLKVKRKKVDEHFRADIESIYAEDGE
jgi:long-chain acyl-CoA synthetase